MLYNIERTEKMVQSMVNATVSHEIRNPVNAIHCQNLTLKMLVERIGDLLDSKYDLGKVKKILSIIRNKISNALDINIASERMVHFLVDDFLDLAQLKAGKFRRADRTFAVHEPINEVFDILRCKAVLQMIELNVSYSNVDENLLVRCDYRRIM